MLFGYPLRIILSLILLFADLMYIHRAVPLTLNIYYACKIKNVFMLLNECKQQMDRYEKYLRTVYIN